MSNPVPTSLRLWSLLCLTAILLVCLQPAAQAGPLVTNGSFESTSLSSPGGYFCQASGNSTCTTNVTGWTSTCGATCGTGATPEALLFPGTNGSAWNGNIGLWGSIATSPDGGNYVAVDGDSNYAATISQTISGLQIGGTYQLQFYQGAAQQSGDNGVTTEQWRVTFGSQTLSTTLMTDPSHGVIAWNQQTLDFTATSASQTLAFFAVGTPNGLPPVVLLDGVGLLQTPEPGTYALVALGLAGILLVTRKS